MSSPCLPAHLGPPSRKAISSDEGVAGALRWIAWSLGAFWGNIDAVADVDLSAFDNVGAESAAVDKRAENRSCGVLLNDFAGLAKPRATAAHFTDHEVTADEAVEFDAAGDEVASMLARAERWLE